MWQLIAEGPDTRQRWKHRLEPNREYVAGRSIDCDLPVPWESALSRRHFLVSTNGSQVQVRCLEEATNGIYLDGTPVSESPLRPADRLVVGQTSFFIRELQTVSGSPEAPVQELRFSYQELQRVHFEDADRRLEALARLPDVIDRSEGEHDSSSALANLILTGIRHADVAAVVARDAQEDVTVTAWERRTETAGSFSPSTRLVSEALHEQRSILHVWEQSSVTDEDYTVSAEFDWAFCTPVARKGQESWGIYVAGKLDHPWSDETPIRQNLQSDVRFAQLVGEVISSAQRMNRMEGQLSVLRQFLSPPILSALEGTGDREGLNIDLLNPKVCDVTVLFCDLRGFSHRAEESADDLPGLLSRVSAALEVMTQEILDHGGVTGDFLGDAVLGFWGWPFASENAPLKACRTALAIRRQFARISRDPDHPLVDFRVGIGVAHGRAVAGKIGTSGRMTVTVFGPVVNLASRLEGMTKKLHASIVLDEPTAQIARERLSPGHGRVRKLASVQPYGMEVPLLVSELVPPEGEFSELSDRHLGIYEQGVQHFINGDWEDAYRALHEMPSGDRAQDFLLALIAQHNRTAPSNWTGVIQLPEK